MQKVAQCMSEVALILLHLDNRGAIVEHFFSITCPVNWSHQLQDVP